MFIDSHCHLDHLNLNNDDLSTVIASAQAEGVDHILNVCIDLEEFSTVLATSNRFSTVFASVGLHPGEQTAVEPTVEQLTTLANHPKVLALGETGLDYYRNNNSKIIQQQRFLMLKVCGV